MIRPFDLELFLVGVLTGSRATRQRHLRQAKTIQAAISDHGRGSTSISPGSKSTNSRFPLLLPSNFEAYSSSTRKKWGLHTNPPDRKKYRFNDLNCHNTKNSHPNYQVGILNNLPELPSSCSTRASSYSENTTPSGTSESIVVKIY